MTSGRQTRRSDLPIDVPWSTLEAALDAFESSIVAADLAFWGQSCPGQGLSLWIKRTAGETPI